MDLHDEKIERAWNSGKRKMNQMKPRIKKLKRLWIRLHHSTCHRRDKGRKRFRHKCRSTPHPVKNRITRYFSWNCRWKNMDCLRTGMVDRYRRRPCPGRVRPANASGNPQMSGRLISRCRKRDPHLVRRKREPEKQRRINCAAGYQRPVYYPDCFSGWKLCSADSGGSPHMRQEIETPCITLAKLTG